MKSKKIGICSTIFVCIACHLSPDLTNGQGIEWQQDISLAKQQAASENKLVLMHFTADWCRPCKNLETFVFTSPVVHHAIAENVIPLKIDVDLHPTVAKEFAVSGIPYDVVITPAGRVVSRRNSPDTIDGYARMMKGLDTIVHDLANGKPSLAQNLQELEGQFSPKTKEIAEDQDFQPRSPNHAAPNPPMYAAQLARNRVKVLQNPGVQQERKAIASISIKNEFVSASENDGFENDFVPPTDTESSSPLLGSNQYFTRNNNRLDPIDNAVTTAKESEIEVGYDTKVAVPAATESLASTSEKNDKAMNGLERSEFALHGKCPVSLMMESKWVDGDKKWGCVHRGQTYLFASQLHRREFLAAPDQFSPLLAGYDPVVFHEQGQLVLGLEEYGVFMGQLPNQRIILFSSTESRDKFQSSPHDYIDTVRTAMRTTDAQPETKLR